MQKIARFEDTPLLVYRLAMIIGVVVVFIDGVVADGHLQLPDFVISLRWLSIVVMGLLLLGSFLSHFVRQHIGEFAFVTLQIVLFYSASVVYGTNLGLDEAMGGVLLLCASSVVFHRIYLVVLNLVTGGSIYLGWAYLVDEPVVAFDKFALSILPYAALFMLLMVSIIKSRQARERSAQDASAWFDNSSDALIYGDAESQTVKKFNDKAREMFASDDGQEIVKLIVDGVRGHSEDEGAASILNDQAGDEDTERVIEFVRTDGKTFWGDVSIRRLEIEGKKQTLVRITDATSRVIHEVELQAAKCDAEKAVVTRNQFLANMSHEIRTPMNGVIGMTSLLMDSNNFDDQQRNFMETIRASGETLLTIINEILDYSKLDAHQIELEEQSFHLESCAAEAMAVVAPVAATKSIELLLDMDLEIPPIYRGDVTRIRQVLVNLLSNAVKFTCEGAVTLHVRAKETRPDSAVKDLWALSLEVEDTGVGIPHEKLETLFDPFTQADASTTREYGGTGLGLTISKQLAELMQGDIHVVSEPGKGSTFAFGLPLHADNRSNDSIELSGTHGRRALLFDTPASVAVLGKYLLQLGMEVDSFTDHSEAVAASRKASYALYIVGSKPDQDPVDLLQSFSSPAEQATPVLLLACLQCNVSRVEKSVLILRKPVRPGELAESVTGLLSSDGAPNSKSPRGMDFLPDLQLNKYSFLLAEDNVVNQKVAAHMLQRLGARVDIVSNGREAIEMLHHRRYDFVFMDMQMPEIDGVEACERIRKDAEILQPYIIAMTANAMAKDQLKCKEAGMDDFIAKPVRLEDVYKTIASAIQIGSLSRTEINSSLEI